VARMLKPLPRPHAYPFIKARNFTPSNRKSFDVVVIHTMECPEKSKAARAVANWFAGPSAPRASAHFCVDGDEVVQGVELRDIAWHAPGCNGVGVGIELAGFAAQSEQEWADAYSAGELGLAAQLVAELCWMAGIEPRWLEPADLLEPGARGITGHVQVNRAFHKSDHTDPGPHFPADLFVLDVLGKLAGLQRAELLGASKDESTRATLADIPNAKLR
jgi:N-acetyl-anhydromuramyl-L-alanine amidase AmpD